MYKSDDEQELRDPAEICMEATVAGKIEASSMKKWLPVSVGRELQELDYLVCSME